MKEDEQKLKSLLKQIEKMRKTTGEPGLPYHDGATLILDHAQEKTELALAKLVAIGKHGESEETGKANDWIFRLMKYLIRIHDITDKNLNNGNKSCNYSISSFAYSLGVKDETQKTFDRFEPLFQFEDVSGIENYAEYMNLVKQRLAQAGKDAGF